MLSNGAGAVSVLSHSERLVTLEARVVGASQDQSNNNKWAQSPGAIAGFTVVFTILAAVCLYFLWRGPNRKAFPCLNRGKEEDPTVTVKDAENALPEDYNARGPANWRDTIVRKEAFFPTPKGTAPPLPLEAGEKVITAPPPRTASLYSYDSRYTTATTATGAPRSNRGSVQDYRNSRPASGRRPPSVGASSSLSIPELPETSPVLGPGDQLFGLPVKTPPHSPQLPRSPASTAPPTDYFGPASPGLLTAGSAYSRSPPTSPGGTPGPVANRKSMRKSVGSAVGVPSPLAQSTVSPTSEMPPQRPELRKSLNASFINRSHSSLRHSTTMSSPPRTTSRTSTRSVPLPPGAGEPLEPVPPLPQFMRNGAGPDDAGPSRPVGDFRVPEGAYPPSHPVALAHAKLSSASTIPPNPSPSPLQYGTPPQSPQPAATRRSPPTRYSPTQGQGYSAGARSPPPLRATSASPEEFLGSPASTTGTSTSSPPASTPPTSVSHYSTPANSIRGHGSTRVVSGKRPGHTKSSSASSPTSSTSSTSSRKRGLWFDASDKPPAGPGVASTMGPGVASTMGPGIASTMGPGVASTMVYGAYPHTPISRPPAAAVPPRV